jgi:hypothetical protein
VSQNLFRLQIAGLIELTRLGGLEDVWFLRTIIMIYLSDMLVW